MSPQPSMEDWTPEMHAEWAEWVAGRPVAIREAVEKYPPGQAYRLTTTGQKVWVVSYFEPDDDGRGVKCRVVTSAFGAVGAELDPDGNGVMIQVFGIPVSELEPWP